MRSASYHDLFRLTIGRGIGRGIGRFDCFGEEIIDNAKSKLHSGHEQSLEEIRKLGEWEKSIKKEKPKTNKVPGTD